MNVYFGFIILLFIFLTFFVLFSYSITFLCHMIILIIFDLKLLHLEFGWLLGIPKRLLLPFHRL